MKSKKKLIKITLRIIETSEAGAKFELLYSISLIRSTREFIE